MGKKTSTQTKAKFIPKVGDRVRFRSWGSLIDEFGADAEGDIHLGRGKYFLRMWKNLCGTEATVLKVDRGGYIAKLQTAVSGESGYYYLKAVEPLLHLSAAPRVGVSTDIPDVGKELSVEEVSLTEITFQAKRLRELASQLEKWVEGDGKTNPVQIEVTFRAGSQSGDPAPVTLRTTNSSHLGLRLVSEVLSCTRMDIRKVVGYALEEMARVREELGITDEKGEHHGK